jgi:hypothetical protein
MTNKNLTTNHYFWKGKISTTNYFDHFTHGKNLINSTTNVFANYTYEIKI